MAMSGSQNFSTLLPVQDTHFLLQIDIKKWSWIACCQSTTSRFDSGQSASNCSRPFI